MAAGTSATPFQKFSRPGWYSDKFPYQMYYSPSCHSTRPGTRTFGTRQYNSPASGVHLTGSCRPAVLKRPLLYWLRERERSGVTPAMSQEKEAVHDFPSSQSLTRRTITATLPPHHQLTYHPTGNIADMEGSSNMQISADSE